VTDAPPPDVARRRSRQTAQRRRADVLAAAAAEIALHGVEGWRSKAVAAEAGISEAYLFRLFATKRDLVHAVAADACDRLARRPNALTTADGLLLLQLIAGCAADGRLRRLVQARLCSELDEDSSKGEWLRTFTVPLGLCSSSSDRHPPARRGVAS
jgi:AcrR family transcriptional regulator